MLIRIVALGNISNETLKCISERIKKTFGGNCVIDDPIINIPKSIFKDARKQYSAEDLINFLKPYAREKKGDKMLAVCNIDIFSKGLNFVFGVAQRNGKICLISLYRLNQRYYGLPSDIKLMRERAAKEAVHEIGHCLGLGHCSTPGCVMTFSNEVVSVDKKNLEFCNSCKQKVSRKI